MIIVCSKCLKECEYHSYHIPNTNKSLPILVKYSNCCGSVIIICKNIKEVISLRL